MMKKLKLVLGICAIGALAAVSCKKKSSSTADPLIGKWKVTQTADDANNNGILDVSELVADTSNQYITFDAKGTGTSTSNFLGIAYSVTFNWLYVDNKAWLQTTITSSTFGSTVGETGSSHIDNLTSSTMTLKDTTSGGVSWTVLAKQ